jgi:hypothetical protein
MSTINPTLPTSSFIGNGDFTWWLGTVKNADDRDANLGRVKVNILGYHKPGEMPSKLPWAQVIAPTDSAGANGVGSAGNQLKPGSFVVGFFLDYPDCQQPVVIGSLLSKITAVIDKNSQNARDYPRSYDNSITGSYSSNKGQPADALGKSKASVSVAAAVAPHSVANPSGQLKNTPVADGKNGGDKTIDTTIAYATELILNSASHTNRIKNATTNLTTDIDSEEQTISVSSTSNFPERGVLRIGDETIGYNGKEETKFVLLKRGFDNTIPKIHSSNESVSILMKSEYLGGETAKEGDLFGAFTDNLVDIKSTIDNGIEMIRDSIWWVVNQIKSFIMSEVTKLLNAIGISAVAPFPMFGKTLTDAIMFIMREISCIIDVSLVDSIMSGIESVINEVLETIFDTIDAVQCIFDAVFDSIFQLVDIANSIFKTVNEIISTFSSLGDISEISDLSDINITGILDFIFGLLGIGCNRDTRDPFAISFTSCPIANVVNCGPGGFSVGSTLSGVPGRWNPEYSKIIGTFSESGTMVVMDDTPYNTRLVIEHGPSKSGIQIYDNGDVRVTNSHNKTDVTIKDQEVVVHGNVTMMVDGNYHLKVGKDYHLEVMGMYNVAVNRESKVTYAGEHKTFFKNDARLESNNGLALVASKVGVSCSGQYELQAPISTSFCTEQNHFAIGSYNVTALYYNEFIGLNVTKVIGGNSIKTRVGTSFESGIGVSNYFQLGSEQEWWGGEHSQIGMGIWTENKLSIDQESTTGVSSFTKLGAELNTITGLTYKQTTGLLLDQSEGLFAETSAAPFVISAPLVSIT